MSLTLPPDDGGDVPADAAPPPPDASAAPNAPAVPVRSPAECAEQLKQRFPALFGQGYKPLKLRIQADIQQRAPGVFSRQVLSAFLHRYTGATAYLSALSRSTQRFDLDGQPAGELSEEHRRAAEEELARRRAQHQAKLDHAAEGRRFRVALLHDFERTTLTPANFCALKGIPSESLDTLLETARREAQERPPRPLAHARRERGRRGPPGGRPDR